MSGDKSITEKTNKQLIAEYKAILSVAHEMESMLLVEKVTKRSLAETKEIFEGLSDLNQEIIKRANQLKADPAFQALPTSEHFSNRLDKQVAILKEDLETAESDLKDLQQKEQKQNLVAPLESALRKRVETLLDNTVQATAPKPLPNPPSTTTRSSASTQSPRVSNNTEPRPVRRNVGRPLPDLPSTSPRSSSSASTKTPLAVNNSKTQKENKADIVPDASKQYQAIKNKLQSLSDKINEATLMEIKEEFRQFFNSPTFKALETKTKDAIEKDYASTILHYDHKVLLANPKSIPKSSKPPFNLTLQKRDNILIEAHSISLNKTSPTRVSNLVTQYVSFVQSQEFQGLKEHIKKDFIRSIDKILNMKNLPIPEHSKLLLTANHYAQKGARQYTIHNLLHQYDMAIKSEAFKQLNPEAKNTFQSVFNDSLTICKSKLTALPKDFQTAMDRQEKRASAPAKEKEEMPRATVEEPIKLDRGSRA